MEKLNKSKSISFLHKIYFSFQTNDYEKIKLELLNYSKPKNQEKNNRRKAIKFNRKYK